LRAAGPSGYRARNRTRLTGPLAFARSGHDRGGRGHAGFTPHRLEIAALRPLEHYRGQPAAHESAGIDTDAIATVFRRLADRVPVHHDPTEALGMRQERFANPPQVVDLLLFDRLSRIDTGMDEQVVADRDHVLEPLDERDIFSRDRDAHHLLRLFQVRLREFGAIDTVAQDRFAPAVAEKMAERLQAVEAAEKHLLVIAGKNADTPALLPIPRQSEDSGTVRPAIDEVPQQDHGRRGGRAGRVVLIDAGDQRFEQVAPTMDVSDRVDSLAGRDGRDRRSRAAGEYLSESLKHRKPGHPLAALC